MYEHNTFGKLRAVALLRLLKNDAQSWDFPPPPFDTVGLMLK